MTIICNAVLQKTTKHTAESTFTSQIADEEITSTAFEMKSFRLPGPVAEKQPRHCNLIRIIIYIPSSNNYLNQALFAQ